MTLSASISFCTPRLPSPHAIGAAPPARSLSARGTPGRALALLLQAVILAFWVHGARAWDADTMLRAARAHGPRAVAGAQALQALLAELAGADEPARLEAINDFFNHRIAFATDLEIWGVEDYWASPLEALGKGRGDCEDYVIAKYFALLASGMPVARLRLVYVQATLERPPGRVDPHMVLAWYATPGAEPLVLDNLDPTIRPASRRRDLLPVFSFNSDGLWQGVGTRALADPAARLSPWREVLAKAREEGFLQ